MLDRQHVIDAHARLDRLQLVQACARASPAPVSSTMHTASCATTSDCCKRCRPRPSVVRRPAGASRRRASVLSPPTRGTNDSAIAAMTLVASPTASTTPSTRISYARGVSCAANADEHPQPGERDEHAERAADQRERRDSRRRATGAGASCPRRARRARASRARDRRRA